MKITENSNAETVTFKLEGKLVKEWVKEMFECWSRVVSAGERRLIRVDLNGVTFVDDAGRSLLSAMHCSGAELNAEEVMMRAVVEEIVGAATR